MGSIRHFKKLPGHCSFEIKIKNNKIKKMIQSTIPLNYDFSDEKLKATIEIVINNWNSSKEGITYFVTDYAVRDNVKEFINERELFRTWDQINSLNDYLENENNYSGLNKKDLEYQKLKHTLLVEIQTKPSYFSKSENWVVMDEL
jgi:hypothetical protein